MREHIVKIYQYDELSGKAKEKARDWWRECKQSDPTWSGARVDTLKAFEKLFPIKVRDWEYGYQNYINFTFTGEDYHETMTGQRLATYLWNNFKTYLYKGKYYSTQGHYDENKKYHYKCRYSRILLEHSCVLTGYSMDDDILQPLYDFMEHPNTRTDYKQLLYECLQAWVQACNNDMEWINADEQVEDSIRTNECEFTESGTIY